LVGRWAAKLGLGREPAAAVMEHAASMAHCVWARHGACTSSTICTLPQRSQVIRRNHDGNARSGCCNASCGVGSGSVP
jgi:hypothetical protein